MSVKIWVAWKVPLNLFDEATKILHQQMSSIVYSSWKYRLSTSLKPNEIKRTSNELIDALMAVEKKYYDIFLKNPVDFTQCWNFGFKFFILEGFIYIIPYGCSNLELPEWFEDFYYQDQVNEDEDIPKEVLKHRKEIWDKLLLKNPQPLEYIYEVLNVSNGFYLAFSPYSKQWFDEVS